MGGGWLPYWGDFKVWYPTTDFESDHLFDFISTQGIQYWYQGQGEAWYGTAVAEEIFSKEVLLYEEDGVRIYKTIE